MAKPHGSSALAVLARAGYKCEYCRRPLNGEYHIDHVTPVTLGGTASLANLAASCPLCNMRKGQRVAGPDPFDWSEQHFFNPRTDEWERHFAALDPFARVGKTAIGRATVYALQSFSAAEVPEDSRWPLIEASRGTDVYAAVNHLRHLRSRHRFGALERGLNEFAWSTIPQELRPIVWTALQILALELRLGRATRRDVTIGLAHAERLARSDRLSPSTRRLVAYHRSNLYQIGATIAVLSGQADQARLLQNRALSYVQTSGIDPLVAAGIRTTRSSRVVRQVVAFSIAAKFDNIEVPAYLGRELRAISRDMPPVDRAIALRFEISALMSSAKRPASRAVEGLYERCTETLKNDLSPTGSQLGVYMMLRRRWLVLHLLDDRRGSLSALQGDVAFWRTNQTFNEPRELSLATKAWLPFIPASKRRELRGYV